jgi:glycine oxidase
MADLEVAVLDRGAAASGQASAAAGGMLSTLHQDPKQAAFFGLCLESRRLYPELVQTLREQTDIDVEYLPWGALELLATEQQRAGWAERIGELRKRDLGIELIDEPELRKLEPRLGSFPHGAVLVSDDHHVSNEELLRALRQACDKLGVRRHEPCEVRRLLRLADHVLGVETSEGYYTAAETIVAAGAWSAALLRGVGLELPLKPVRGQILALRSELVVRHVLWLEHGYLVPRFSGELLVGSTLEDVGFRVANTVGGLERLVRLALQFCPALEAAEVSRQWSGLRPMAADGLPVLGRFGAVKGLLAATGHYRDGILLTPVTARILAELLLQGSTTLDLGEFSPDRFSKA